MDEAKEESSMSKSDQELCRHIARKTHEKRMPSASKERIVAVLRDAAASAEPARAADHLTGDAPRKR